MIKHVTFKKVKNCEQNIDYEGTYKGQRFFSQLL